MVKRETLAGRKYPAIKAAEIKAAMSEIIEPYLAARSREFTLNRPGGIISGTMYTADSHRGTVVISHGFTESSLKFRELIYYFLNEGYSVCAPDHRGHGKSRTVIDCPTDIDSFDTYVADFAAVIDAEVKQLEGIRIVFAHSMGGLIAVRYIERNPGVFSKAVLSSPLLEVNTGGIPPLPARLFAEALCLFGRGRKYLPGHHEYRGGGSFKNSPATCEERFTIYNELQKSDVHLQNGGASCRWVRSAFRMCAKVLAKRECAKVTLPVLLFQAENDAYVMPGGQEKFISRIPCGRIVHVPGSRHEIYMSGDDMLPLYLGTVFDFIA